MNRRVRRWLRSPTSANESANGRVCTRCHALTQQAREHARTACKETSSRYATSHVVTACSCLVMKRPRFESGRRLRTDRFLKFSRIGVATNSSRGRVAFSLERGAEVGYRHASAGSARSGSRHKESHDRAEPFGHVVSRVVRGVGEVGVRDLGLLR